MRIPFYHCLPPRRMSRLSTITAESHGTWTTILEPAEYQTRIPSDASPELKNYFAAHATVAIDEIAIAEVPEGRFFHGGVIISPCGRFLARDVSLDIGASIDRHWITDSPKLRRPQRLKGRSLAVESAGSYCYYHWLLDELPRLLLCQNTLCDHLLAASPFFHDEVLRFLGFYEKQIPLQGWSHFRSERLIVPTYLGISGNPAPLAIELLEDFGERFIENQDVRHSGEKLFISRAKANGRRIVNEDELWRELRARGFVKLELENLTFAAQIAAFQHAKCIVAPHGSGLANLVFCRQGCRVIELFHVEYTHYCFWQLSHLKKLQYHGFCFPLHRDAAQSASSGQLDIKIELSEILPILDAN